MMKMIPSKKIVMIATVLVFILAAGVALSLVSQPPPQPSPQPSPILPPQPSPQPPPLPQSQPMPPNTNPPAVPMLQSNSDSPPLPPQSIPINPPDPLNLATPDRNVNVAPTALATTTPPQDKTPQIPDTNPSREMAKRELMEVENAYANLHVNFQSKDTEDLLHIAKELYERSTMYYEMGDYRSSLIYSQLSLETIHAIEKLGGD